MCDQQSQALLAWYDKNARAMPWRVAPADRRAGVLPDPYHVWLSEVMLQQTTVATVGSYFKEFTRRWPDVHALAGAEDADVMAAWAGLGYYARARNLLACARVVSTEYGGQFPADRAGLLALPGIGPYTAAAISSIAFDQAETVLDGNVERVMARLHRVETPLPLSKPELFELAARRTPAKRPGDYAQAVMDLGATICTPRAPRCGICPLAGGCQARAAGVQQDLPAKLPKKPKPIRKGIAYICRRRDGAWLMERRPPKGLLGGMLGWPGTDWAEGPARNCPPFAADWHDAKTEVRHTFTHFHLHLAVQTAMVDTIAIDNARGQIWVDKVERDELPTLMRKAYDLAKGWRGFEGLAEKGA